MINPLRKSSAKPAAEPAGKKSPGPKPLLKILPKFRSSKPKKILAIELGKWTTKAVHLEVKGDSLKLLSYVVQPSSGPDYTMSREGWTALLQSIHKASGAETKRVVLCLSMADALLRQIEMPAASLADQRRMLRINPQFYLQQDVRDIVLDCCQFERAPEAQAALPPATPETDPAAKVVPLPSAKKQAQLMVGGAARQLIMDLHAACQAAGLILEEVTFSQIALLNGALATLGEQARSGTLALVDIGFRNTTITILLNGQVALNRVVSFGGDQLTNGLAQVMEANYRVAEAIKVTLPEKVQDKLTGVFTTLAHELRTALDFFEKQYETQVTETLVTGASARSKFLMELLQNELGVPCKPWNLTTGLILDLPENQVAELQMSSSQLAPVIGAAQAWLTSPQFPINLLSEQLEKELELRRDPVRWSWRIAITLVIIMLGWASWLAVRLAGNYFQIYSINSKMNALTKGSRDVAANSSKIGELEKTLRNLNRVAENRFLWTGPINALQFVEMDRIQVISVQMRQTMVPLVDPKRPPTAVEQRTMLITAKNYGDLAVAQKFIREIANSPYFKSHLREKDSVLLRERHPEQVDPFNPEKTFSLFTIELLFVPREVEYE